MYDDFSTKAVVETRIRKTVNLPGRTISIVWTDRMRSIAGNARYAGSEIKALGALFQSPSVLSPRTNRIPGRVGACNLAVKTEPTFGEPSALGQPFTQPVGMYDLHGRNHTYLRLSLTERCNLRCQYCMPEEGNPVQPTEKLLTAAELIKVANFFIGEGVYKIRLTGGEPLMSPHLFELCKL